MRSTHVKPFWDSFTWSKTLFVDVAQQWGESQLCAKALSTIPSNRKLFLKIHLYDKRKNSNYWFQKHKYKIQKIYETFPDDAYVWEKVQWNWNPHVVSDALCGDDCGTSNPTKTDLKYRSKHNLWTNGHICTQNSQKVAIQLDRLSLPKTVALCKAETGRLLPHPRPAGQSDPASIKQKQQPPQLS